MSLVTLLVAFLIGVVVGPLLVWALAPVFDSLAKTIVKLGIRAGGDWVLKPVGGTKYDLETVEYEDAEGKAWRAGGDDDDDREYYDDAAGRMRTLFGKSFGVAVEDVAAVVDPVDCKIGELEGEKAADGGQLAPDTTFTLDGLREIAHVGTVDQRSGDVVRRIQYVNPFVSVTEDDSQTIVDVRDAVTLLSSNGSPETPRKTAENAAAAERAFEDWGELKRNASLIAAFLMGAIVAEFIAGGGGGGGGVTSSVSLTLSVVRPLTDIAALTLGVA